MKDFIGKWLKDGLINKEQALKMQMDINRNMKDKTMSVFIFIGIAIVITALIFLTASNWQILPHLLKIAIFFILTFASAFFGYFMSNNKEFGKIGSFFIFLSALFLGVLLFTIAQTYDVNIQLRYRSLLLLWLVFIFPLVYILRSKYIAYLSCAIFGFWITIIILQVFDTDIFQCFPYIYCLLGIFFFCLGKAHDFFDNLTDISQAFCKIGFLIICPAFFLTTFSFFLKSREWINILLIHFGIININIAVLELVIAQALILFLFAFKQNKTILIYETTALSVFIVFLFAFIWVDTTGIIPNSLFLLFILMMIVSGYRKKELFYINIASFWLIVFIIAKYCDFFWEVLPNLYFFLIGIIVMLASIFFIEQKRQNLKRKIFDNSGQV